MLANTSPNAALDTTTVNYYECQWSVAAAGLTYNIENVTII